MDLLQLSRLEWMRVGLVGVGLLAIPSLTWAQAAATTAAPAPAKSSPPAVSARASQLLKPNFRSFVLNIAAYQWLEGHFQI